MNHKNLWILPLLGITTCAASVRAADPSTVGGFGLIQALPLSFFIGIGLLLVGVSAGIIRKAQAEIWRWLHIVALSVFLHGLPGLIEKNPRFPVAWLHVGFSHHIATHGTLLTDLDARFSWAGFFAGSALLERAAGTTSVLWLVRFTPVAVSLFACWAIMLLGRGVGIGSGQCFFAASLYLLVNWSGQDYFSPQATAFCLYVAIMVVSVTVFKGAGPGADSLLGRLSRPTRRQACHVSTRTSVLVLLGLVVTGVAIVVSHQLTPAFLVLALVSAGVVRATRVRAFSLVIAAAAFAWFALAAQPYWTGHLGDVTESTGQLGSIVETNVGARSAGADLHRLVGLYARGGLALVVWVTTGLAIFLGWMRHRTPVALAALFVAPFPALLVQPYGGEVVIRVFLFSLPPAVLVISQLFSPDRLTRGGRLIKWAPAVVLLLCLPVFLVGRFGNEAFEQVSDNDRSVVAALNRVAPDHSVAYVVNSQTIVYSDRVADIRYDRVLSRAGADILDEIDRDKVRGGKYILLTESQHAYGVTALGRPPGWLSTIAEELRSSGRVTTVARAGTSVLFELPS